MVEITGVVMIVIGLYSVLWGKCKESIERLEDEEIVELAMKGGDQLPVINEGIETIQKKRLQDTNQPN
ncbi:unnamed protein product [Citrullus colocynthis]|uniref:Uncharacterized protein n=1 Tax=Citrullus colocynthis TaxID=252529 RepID=A0ABP0YR12_9ROSI